MSSKSGYSRRTTAGASRCSSARSSARKRRGGADDVAAEADLRRALQREQVRVDGVLEVHPAVEQLVDLQVEVVIRRPRVVAVVVLGEEARGAQDQAGQAVVAPDELAQVLGRGLGDAVDVARHRGDVLGDPRRGALGRRGQGAAEGARGAREQKAADPGRHRLLEQVERAGDVRVHELTAAVRADVRLVQGGRVDDRVDARHRLAHAVAVGDRADHAREVRGQQVQAHHVVVGSDRGPGRAPRPGARRSR